MPEKGVHSLSRLRIRDQIGNCFNLRLLPVFGRGRKTSLGGEDGGRAISGNRRGKCLKPRANVLFCATQYRIHQTLRHGLLRPDDVALQDQPTGERKSGDLAQPECPARRRNQAEFRFGQAEPGPLRRDPEIAREGELQPAADGGPLNFRNGYRIQRRQPVVETVKRPDEARHLLPRIGGRHNGADHPEIGARAKGLTATPDPEKR